MRAVSAPSTGESQTAGSFDLAVIGAGSAGFSAAITGAELGARVALIGHGTLGGTCVNIGCVPSKTLIRATETLHHAAAANRFAGIEAKARLVDWSALVAQKDALVAALRQSKYADLLPHYEAITYLDGPARLTPQGVDVNGRKLSARHIIIATGARPAVPAVPGLDNVPFLTSTEALDLDHRPGSLIVMGGGYIGAELAQMFARTGTTVTLVMRTRLLPKAEPEIGAALTRYLRDEGLDIREGLTYRGVRKTARGIALDVTEAGHARTIEADHILIATGRRPNSEGLGLDDIGIARNSSGGIEVDEHMRTARDHIYAAGDVTGRDQFVYMAAYGARIAVGNALNGKSLRYDATAMPAVVFTDPQVASVGLTEAEARAQGTVVRTSVLPLDYVPRALAARDTRGLIKLVADADSDRLLGAHILAPEGADTIGAAALAIRSAMTVSDLADTIFPYLTTVEGLKLAAQTFEKDVARLSCCAG